MADGKILLPVQAAGHSCRRPEHGALVSFGILIPDFIRFGKNHRHWNIRPGVLAHIQGDADLIHHSDHLVDTAHIGIGRKAGDLIGIHQKHQAVCPGNKAGDSLLGPAVPAVLVAQLGVIIVPLDAVLTGNIIKNNGKCLAAVVLVNQVHRQRTAHDAVIRTAGQRHIGLHVFLEIWQIVFRDIVSGILHGHGQPGQQLVQINRFAAGGNAHNTDKNGGIFAIIRQGQGIVAVGAQPRHRRGAIGIPVIHPDGEAILIPHKAIRAYAVGVRVQHLPKPVGIIGVDMRHIPARICTGIAGGSSAALPVSVQLFVRISLGKFHKQPFVFVHIAAGEFLPVQFLLGEAGVGPKQNLVAFKLLKTIGAFNFTHSASILSAIRLPGRSCFQSPVPAGPGPPRHRTPEAVSPG